MALNHDATIADRVTAMDYLYHASFGVSRFHWENGNSFQRLAEVLSPVFFRVYWIALFAVSRVPLWNNPVRLQEKECESSSGGPRVGKARYPNQSGPSA
jgi:hypothetical protein